MTNAQRLCECGCSCPLTGRQRKWASDACKSRGKRRRRDPDIGSFARKLRRREGLDKRYAGRVRFQVGRDLREWGPGGNLNPLVCDDPAAAANSNHATYTRSPDTGALQGFFGFPADELFIGFVDRVGSMNPPEAGWHAGPYWPRQKPRHDFNRLAASAGLSLPELRATLRHLVSERIEDIQNVGGSLKAVTGDEIATVVSELELRDVSMYEISGEPRFWIKANKPMGKFARLIREKFGAMPRERRRGNALPDFDTPATGYDDRCRACGKQMHGLQALHRRECRASDPGRIWRTFDTWVAPPATELPPMKWAHSEAWFEATYRGRSTAQPYTVTYPAERGRNIQKGREEVVSLSEYRALRAQLEIQGESLARIETMLAQIAMQTLRATGSPTLAGDMMTRLLLSAQIGEAA